MTDLLVVQDENADKLRETLTDGASERRWVRSIDVVTCWEPLELEINGRNAIAYMKGKHKVELAELMLRLIESNSRVVHVQLHRSSVERVEVDLEEWAKQWASEER